MDIFYTYALRVDGDEYPFYVGKGKGDRAKAHMEPRDLKAKSYKNNIISKAIREGKSILIDVYYRCLPEWLAFDMEKAYIAHFGRKDNGTGILTNLTDGGDGPSGTIPKKKKTSPFKGVPRSESAKANMRKPRTVPRTREHTEKIRAKVLGRKATIEELNNQSIATFNRTPIVWKKSGEILQIWEQLDKPSAYTLGKTLSMSESSLAGIIGRFKKGWIPNQDPVWINWANSSSAA